MAVAFQAQGTAEVSTGVAGTSTTFTNLTVASGSNLCLIAALTFPGDPGAFSKQNWDDTGTPQAFTLITTAAESDGFARTYLFGLVNPHLGANTLAFNWTNSLSFVIDAVSFTGVDQTGGGTTFKNPNSFVGSAVNPAPIIVSSPTGDMGIALFAGAGSITFGAGSTGTQVFVNDNHLSTSMMYNPGTGSTAISVVVSGGVGTPMVISGLDIAAAVSTTAPLNAQIWI